MTRAIYLNTGESTIVDNEDYAYLSQFSWHRTGYKKHYVARSTNRNGAILIHREIMSAPKGTQIDHIDRDPFNNTRANLRFVTPSQNSRNQGRNRPGVSQYKGVSRHSRQNPWRARILVDGHELTAYAKTEVEAARLYDQMALDFWGADATYLNFPDESIGHTKSGKRPEGR